MTRTTTATGATSTTILTIPPRPPFPPRAATSITTSPFQLARLADHTDREERLTQVHLARWAADLQRSLQNERERYAALQREERRAWLAERMSECVDEEIAAAGLREYGGEVEVEVAGEVELAGHGAGRARRSLAWGMGKGVTGVGANGSANAGGLSARDPLGLLEWDERVRQRGVAIVKVLGGCGVIGALAVWVLRNWEVTPTAGSGSMFGIGIGSGWWMEYWGFPGGWGMVGEQ